MRGDAPVRIQRFQHRQPPARLADRSGRRRIEPAQARRIAHPPKRAVEQQAGKIAFQYLGRVEGRHARRRRRLPQPIGDARSLPRRTSRALDGRRLACPFRHQPRDTGRAIIARTPRQAGIHDDPHALDGQAGFRDGGRQDDLASPGPGRPDRGALGGGVQASVQLVHLRRAALQPFGRPLDLRHAGQKGQQVALRFLGQRQPDRSRHLILDPLFRRTSQMAQVQGLYLPRALDDGRLAQQRGEASAIQRRRHRHDAQVRPQRVLRIECQRQPEIAVQAALMHLVEQHSGHACQFRIVLDSPHENAFGQHQQPRARGLPAVHARCIADGPARFLAHQFRDPLRRRARRQASGRKQQDLAGAPWFAQQRGRDRRRLARAGRRHQHGVAACTQDSEQIGQHGMDGQVDHSVPVAPFLARRKGLLAAKGS